MAEDHEILAAIATLDTKMDGMKDDIERLTHVVIDGNGQPGLVTRVDRLEQVASRRNTNSDIGAKGRWNLLSSIIGGLVAGAATIVIFVFFMA